jgi:hypothetical protein
MVRSQKPPVRSARQEAGSKKVGILLPYEAYELYEEVARSEHITVAQVIARVAIEFAEIEREASHSRRAIIGSYKDGRRLREGVFNKLKER